MRENPLLPKEVKHNLVRYGVGMRRRLGEVPAIFLFKESHKKKTVDLVQIQDFAKIALKESSEYLHDYTLANEFCGFARRTVVEQISDHTERDKRIADFVKRTERDGIDAYISIVAFIIVDDIHEENNNHNEMIGECLDKHRENNIPIMCAIMMGNNCSNCNHG